VVQLAHHYEDTICQLVVVQIPLLGRREDLAKVVNEPLYPCTFPSSARLMTSAVLTTWFVVVM
jgi:hypothetical protein